MYSVRWKDISRARFTSPTSCGTSFAHRRIASYATFHYLHRRVQSSVARNCRSSADRNCHRENFIGGEARILWRQKKSDGIVARITKLRRKIVVHSPSWRLPEKQQWNEVKAIGQARETVPEKRDVKRYRKIRDLLGVRVCIRVPPYDLTRCTTQAFSVYRYTVPRDDIVSLLKLPILNFPFEGPNEFVTLLCCQQIQVLSSPSLSCNFKFLFFILHFIVLKTYT